MVDLVSLEVVKSAQTVKLPPGFELAGTANKKGADAGVAVATPSPTQIAELKVKKAWEVALGPAKLVPMNLFMAYMAGNSLQIIPIMMTFMLLWNPIKSIFTETNAQFKHLQTPQNASDILLTKAVFVVCQLGCLGVGVWKLNGMGLIPNLRSDWLGWEELPPVREWSALF